MKRLAKKLQSVVLLIAICFSNVQCANVFERYLAETDTDRALLYEARKLVDQKRYSEAQSKLRLMTSAFFAEREVQVLYASTFAGLCGLDAIQLALNLSQNNSGGTDTLFKLLFTAFARGTTTSIAYCKLAESTLAAVIDNPNTRGTVDEYFLMIFISLAKIGNVLTYAADADANTVVDTPFNHCTDAELTNLNVAEVGVSLTRILTSLTGAATTIAGIPNANLSALCAQVAALPGITTSPCDYTNATTMAADAQAIKAVKMLIGTSDVGLGTCNGGTNPTMTNCLVVDSCFP